MSSAGDDADPLAGDFGISRDFHPVFRTEMQLAIPAVVMRPGLEAIQQAVNAAAQVGVFFFFLFYFFFLFKFQTPVTLCSGELWSILVVRLAHSVDLRS